jgi:hypothetical protein
MWNPFKKFLNKSNLNIDFDLVNNIYQHIYNIENDLAIDVINQNGQVEAFWYNFPEYYQNTNDKKRLTENGFKNFYELLNDRHSIANVHKIDIQNAIDIEEQYQIFEFSFNTEPVGETEKMTWNSVPCYFYFIFVMTENSTKVNDFKVFYTRWKSNNSIENFIKSKFILDINNPKAEDLIYIEALERNLVALSQHLKLPISDKLQKKYPESLLPGPVTVKDFKRLIELVNYNPFEEDIDKTAEDLFESYQSDWDNLNEDVDYPTDNYFPYRYDILEDYWQSDWKFDPEDADGFIGDMLGIENWGFAYPKETYSHNLFPYIQSALAKMGLELMDLDAQGDAYNFFVVHKKDVAEIINLSQKMKIGILKVE